MKSEKPWVKDLNISPEDFALWREQISGDESITQWSILHGKLETQTYLDWAQDHYGLALLTDEFFEQKVDREFWNKIDGVANWSDQMIPLCFWDGVLFIACVEPLEHLQFSFPVQFVLADPHHLKAYWVRLQNEATQITRTMNTLSIQEGPEGLTLTSLKEPALDPPAPEEEGPSDSPEVSPPENIEGMEGLPPIPSAGASGPEGLTSVDFNLTSVLESPESDETEEISADSIIEGPAGLEDPGPKAEAPELPLPPPPVTPPPPKQEPVEEALPSETPIDENDPFQWLFNELHSQFSRSMVLKVESGAYKIWQKDDRWNPRVEQPDDYLIETQSPSVFRVVYRTKLPYHGRVAASEVNDHFFHSFGLPGSPECLTLAPIKKNKKVIGALLAIGGQEQRSGDSLNFVRDLAKKFAEKVEAPAKAA